MALFTHASLLEKFLGGESVTDGYTEVYENPTAAEMSTFFALGYRVPEIGAIVRGRNLYVWDRRVATHNTISNYLRDTHNRVSQADDAFLVFFPLKVTTLTGGLLVSMSLFSQKKVDYGTLESIVYRLLSTPTASEVSFVFSSDPGDGFKSVQNAIRQQRGVSPKLTRLNPKFL